jgi:hypothetical protein
MVNEVKVFKPTKIRKKKAGDYGLHKVTTAKTRMLVMDDRLISKQYLKGRIDVRISDDSFDTVGEGAWADATDIAPSKNTLNNYLNSLEVSTSAWTQEAAGDIASKTRTYDSGFVGIGSTLHYTNDITEMLTVGGNIKGTGNLLLKSDSAVLKFGADSDTTLTHYADNGMLLNSTRKIYFEDGSNYDQYIGSAGSGVTTIAAPTEIDLTATTIDINGIADISGNTAVGGNLTVGGTATITGNTTVNGNLTVTGTATAIQTETVEIFDNIIVLNTNSTVDAAAGIEVERGSDTNTSIKWEPVSNKWQLTNNGSDYYDISTSSTDHNAITIDNQGTGLLALSTQALTVNDVFVHKTNASEMTGKLTLTGTEGGGGTGTTALDITGGNSSATNPAVNITGHLVASTKSFNIPHPIDSKKRLVYGCLEGPEHSVYNRGTIELDIIPDRISVDLPDYWYKLVGDDYTIMLTPYGPYNVWVEEKTEDGFFVSTSTDHDVKFDWTVIGGRKDAVIPEVEPQYGK